jgi:hypothetical protein
MFDKKTLNALCTPAKIYLAIAIVASVVALFRGVTFGAVFVKLLFAFFWTYVLGWFCKKGLSYLSWFLVLLPYVVILLAALRIANITEHRGIFRSLGIQGAYGQEAFGRREGMEDNVTEEKCKKAYKKFEKEKPKVEKMMKSCEDKGWWSSE